MNNIITQFDQILEFAKTYQLPLTKKRAILREYLQSKLLEKLYAHAVSAKVFFVGGTSLRLLRGLPRFSEDLDFDVLGTTSVPINQLVEATLQSLRHENIAIDFYQNRTVRRAYYEFRFTHLLADLGLSSNQQEKLMIKFDFEYFWQGLRHETVLFQRYGFLAQVVTASLNQLLTQKVYAYIHRKQTQPRDMYDIVWLTSHGATMDHVFMQANSIPAGIIKQAMKKFEHEKGKSEIYKRRLRPYLIEEEDVAKIEFFPDVLQRL